MSPSYDSTTSLKGVEKVYRLFLPDYVVLTFIMMLGFYILLRAFGISAWLAGLGGVIWAFSSYFFYQVSDDDYGDYFHSIYAIANDYYFIGFASIF